MTENNVPPQKSRLRTIAAHVIKLAIGCSICAFLLRKYDFQEVFASARLLDASSIFWIWFWMLLGLWCHSVMLQRALLPLKMKLTVGYIYKVAFQIRFYSLFLPGAANIFVKWYKLAKPGRQPAQALTVMVFTRCLHVFAIFLLAVTGMWCDSRFPWPHVKWLGLAGLLISFALVALFVSTAVGKPLDRLMNYALNLFPSVNIVRTKAQKLASMVTLLRQMNKGQVVLLLLLSVAGQLFQTFSHMTIANAINMDITVWMQLWIRGVILICAIVPVTLSGLGIREASIVAVLLHYGIAEPVALAYSLIYFALIVGVGLLGGAFEIKDHFFPSLANPREASR